MIGGALPAFRTPLCREVDQPFADELVPGPEATAGRREERGDLPDAGWRCGRARAVSCRLRAREPDHGHESPETTVARKLSTDSRTSLLADRSCPCRWT